ncbi:hypothetical protein MUA02_01085 [Enterobacteriaceae bacterium H20N1]|uniref:Uncharacterized protein n=1 Tax=Dryocola boscaweniae TaxID=2925397 RepID=A0A9X2W4P8_9ENTR|nr:hypothetical protein [Dryocola boscaweniae]MCT4700501.1 hypothetical protein [Dryocola boscaweniae]MCT4717657.1 hypothetical protein [Dryocola boscaweniae]
MSSITASDFTRNIGIYKHSESIECKQPQSGRDAKRLAKEINKEGLAAIKATAKFLRRDRLQTDKVMSPSVGGLREKTPLFSTVSDKLPEGKEVITQVTINKKGEEEKVLVSVRGVKSENTGKQLSMAPLVGMCIGSDQERNSVEQGVQINEGAFCQAHSELLSKRQTKIQSLEDEIKKLHNALDTAQSKQAVADKQSTDEYSSLINDLKNQIKLGNKEKERIEEQVKQQVAQAEGLTAENATLEVTAKTLANDGKRSYGWAIALSGVTAGIAALITALGASGIISGDSQADKADDAINTSEQDLDTATNNVEAAQTEVVNAENADYDTAGVTAGNTAITEQIDQDRRDYLNAQGSGDTDKMAEIAGRYGVMPDGSTPNFNLNGLNASGEEYMTDYYNEGYESGVTEARNEAVTAAKSMLAEAKTSKTHAQTALDNAGASKNNAKETKEKGVETLAVGLPVALAVGGLLTAINALHVRRKNTAIVDNMKAVDKKEYENVRPVADAGIRDYLKVFSR